LFRRLDDSDLRQSILESCDRRRRGRRGQVAMLIDWFTVGAQAVNFLILVWLMQRFLYKPILGAIDAREKSIAAALADATATRADAIKERDGFRHKSEEFEHQRATLLSKAVDDAKAERDKLVDEARTAADALSEQQRDAMRSEATSLRQAIGQRTQQEVFAIARKTLSDLATVTLEERLGEVFTRRLRTMDEGSKASLGAAITNAINETFLIDVHPRFETSPELVSGIELMTNGQKLAWSISDYLRSVENGVEEIMRARSKAEAAPPPPPAPTPEPRRE
jgi:F-type H+-transporting ATPase subunit b